MVDSKGDTQNYTERGQRGGKKMDIRATETAGRANPQLEAMAAFYRRTDTGRQGGMLKERLGRQCEPSSGIIAGTG